MIRQLLGISVLLLTTMFVAADGPVSKVPLIPNEVQGLKLPDSVEADVDDWITVTAVTEGKVVMWVSLDGGLKVFPSHLLKDSKTIIASARKAGTYKVLAYTAINGEPSQPAVCTIIVKDMNPPQPNPGPGPNPGPLPKPPTDAWLIVIESTKDATDARGKMLASTELKKYFDAKHWKHVIADVNVKDVNGNTPSKLKPYVDMAKASIANGKTLPQMWLVDQDGLIRIEGTVPSSPEELLNLLKKVGG